VTDHPSDLASFPYKPFPAVSTGRSVEYATAISNRSGGFLGHPPAPWGANHQTTAFMTNWHRAVFPSFAEALTIDPFVAVSKRKILIPAQGPYRIVVHFHEERDEWAGWPFREMKLARDEIRAAYPHLTLSAYVDQAYLIHGENSPLMPSRIAMLEEFAKGWDEISPSLYYHEDDDFTPSTAMPGRVPSPSMYKQHRTMEAWSKYIAPGKPLSPCVGWFVEGRGYRLCTKDQFWKVQVAGALSVPSTRAVILRGSIDIKSEIRIFDAGARPIVGR